MRRVALAALLILAACKSKSAEAPGPKAAEPADDREIVYRSHRAMGTQLTITAYTAEPERAVKAMEAAFAEFNRLETLLSVWRPKSDVSRINHAAGKEAVEVSPETLEVVERGLELAEKTDGKFDITFGALAGLWKFDHDQDDQIPSDEDIQARVPLVGYERVLVDHDQRTVKLADAGMRMHLGGIGKGYAVDRAVRMLRAAGLEDFMVQAGGDMYCAGKKGDRPWRVGVRDPRKERSEFFAFAEVTDQTFSTSGDYERFFIKDGKRYHHILDPDLGRPARGTRSVTVMADDAMTADVLSTAVFILGADRGLAVVESIDGAGAIVVDEDNEVHVSKRLEGRLKVIRPPTP